MAKTTKGAEWSTGSAAACMHMHVPQPFLAGEIERIILEWEELDVGTDVIDAGISRDLHQQCMREVWVKCNGGGAKLIAQRSHFLPEDAHRSFSPEGVSCNY